MKIGIITIQKCNNFGADLQAYALQKKLRMMGYDAENIDYLFYKHPRHLNGKRERPVFKLSLVNRAKEMLFPVLERARNLRNRKVMAVRKAKFSMWTDRHLKGGSEYRSVDSLYENPPRYDVYMVGSDQVWNPRMGSNILPYFLDFAPEGARCVSFAASLGVSSVSPEVYAAYRRWLSRFPFIGLRERSGERIIDGMGLNAEVKSVLDPTLLLTATEWAEVAEEPSEVPSDYLLLYDLIPSSETVVLAERWAKMRGLRIVRLGDGAYGPGEFVWLMAHAECVVTNSFHGAAFAIIHGKPFYSVIPHGMSNAARIEGILATVGLPDRLVRAGDVADFKPTAAIDWTLVRSKFTAARADSIDFLVRSLVDTPRVKPAQSPRACYALWNKDGAIRARSTSGGLFSSLACDVLAEGGVVFGAAFDPGFHRVRHVAARTPEELSPLRMSKYVASDATAAIKEAKGELAAGKRVLFTGTPCQVAAMRAAAKGMDDELLLVDIVCHGTPRPEVFDAYARELESRFGAPLTRYEFRNKDHGWNFPDIVYSFANGVTRRVLPWLDPYFHGYSINAFLQEACYRCPFARLARTGDVTIGDCWRVATSHPQYDDGKGVSLLLANTEKGEAVASRLASLSQGGRYDVHLAQLRNMPLFEPAVRPPCAARFNEVFASTGSFAQAANAYVSRKSMLKRFVMYWVKRLGWFVLKRHQ